MPPSRKNFRNCPKRFYKQLVRKADERFDEHLKRLEAENGGKR